VCQEKVATIYRGVWENQPTLRWVDGVTLWEWLLPLKDWKRAHVLRLTVLSYSMMKRKNVYSFGRGTRKLLSNKRGITVEVIWEGVTTSRNFFNNRFLSSLWRSERNLTAIERKNLLFHIIQRKWTVRTRQHDKEVKRMVHDVREWEEVNRFWRSRYLFKTVLIVSDKWCKCCSCCSQ
jgi:hypothetical protein